jgi:tetratricopeptide (TPR) repeat protein
MISNKICILFFVILITSNAGAQQSQTTPQQETQSVDKVKKASRKIESGYKKNNKDTLAQGFFDLGEMFYQKGELGKSETYYKKAKDIYENSDDADGIAKSSRALARVQEDQHKDKEAIDNYSVARNNTLRSSSGTFDDLNTNDIARLKHTDSLPEVESLIQRNINLGYVNKDTLELVRNYSLMGRVNMQTNKPEKAVSAWTNAFKFSQKVPEQAIQFNQQITDVYLNNKDFNSAIATKQTLLDQSFVANSTTLKAKEMNSLASIYILKNNDSAAVRLLREAYEISVTNGHTLVAKTSVEKLDSLFRAAKRKDLSLKLYKDFLDRLPSIVAKDSSIADNRLFSETESRIKELESERQLKDALIHRKNVFSYWLIGSLSVLVIFAFGILYVLRKLRIRNKKIALQSLRREMNPHFIFNSLNSINQFIASNNELEANRYLTKFSTLMRRVMENSKDDFVPLSKEMELLETYLELEQTRFPDKFEYRIDSDHDLLTNEYSIPGMLIQPYLENAIWHGLRYTEQKGLLSLHFSKIENRLVVKIEDNGIGIEASKRNKTVNQQQHKGRGITNTIERIQILNELYHHDIICEVVDKAIPDHGVVVTLKVPLLKNNDV